LTKAKVVIFDVDGTLANCEHRLRFITERPKRWKEFFAEQENDALIEPIATLFRSLRSAGTNIIVLTARPGEYRAETERWLLSHDLGGYSRLIMREAGDRRNDQYVKKDVLDRLRAEGYEIVFAVEDRARVCAMWRENGVTCLQVAEGNF